MVELLSALYIQGRGKAEFALMVSLLNLIMRKMAASLIPCIVLISTIFLHSLCSVITHFTMYSIFYPPLVTNLSLCLKSKPFNSVSAVISCLTCKSTVNDKLVSQEE